MSSTTSPPAAARRPLVWLSLLFFAEGLPFGLFAEALPVVLRGQGASLSTIGDLQSLQLAWSLKLLWSPLVQRRGSWRRWMGGSIVVMASTLALLAYLSGGAPLAHPTTTLLAGMLLLLFAIASATQDLAIDGATRPTVAW